MKRELLAKPSGITLKEHTSNVIAQANIVIRHFKYVFDKYNSITKKDLKKRLLISCKFHDLGKSNIDWQNACWKDYLQFLDWTKHNDGTYQKYERENRTTAGKNLMKAGVRHEIFSLILASNNLSIPVQIAIAAHHKKLSLRAEKRWYNDFKGKEREKATNLFKKYIGLNDGLDNFESAISKVYEFSTIRSLLVLCDHRASRKEAYSELPKFKKFNYLFPDEWERRDVQRLAEENWEDELLLIRAATGAGKTDAALLWAKKQIKNNRADRLIIAMPTRFTSNALAIGATEKLSQTGLFHSTAQFSELYQNSDSVKDLHEFSRQLLTPCTVCTIDHLLIALTLMRDDHHSILTNLASSCLVIDEADFYDEFTQANIVVLLKVLKEWKVPVMIMSASLPESTLKLYKNIGYNIDEIKEDTFEYDRPRCEVKSIEPYEKVDELEELLLQCVKEERAIIYANTVAKAIEFYDWFEEKGIKPILYHSRFIEPHKKEKEEELINALGKEAWENGTATGIAILTQIGEMSVNISADLMLSDLCPIDRLVQRAGRLSRFSKNIGNLHVLIPQKNKKDYPAPYGAFIRKKGWLSNKAFISTKEKLTCRKYSAEEFVKFINLVYPKLENFNYKSINNANLLKDHFKDNWLITPIKKTEEDEEQTDYWKSRDIDNNKVILIKRPKDFYVDYFSYQSFRISNGIGIHPYMLERGMRKFYSIADLEITIGKGEHKEKVYYLTDTNNSYSKEKGLMIEKGLDAFL